MLKKKCKGNGDGKSEGRKKGVTNLDMVVK